jgi:hypothetical protein
MIKTSTMLLVALTLCVSVTAQSKPEDNKIPIFVKPAERVPLGPPLTSGAVDDNTYKNDSLGLQFAPTPGLKFSVPELKGKPGTLPLLVTVAAWSELNVATVFYAEDLGYYAQDRRSTKTYVERVIGTQKKKAWIWLRRKGRNNLGA